MPSFLQQLSCTVYTVTAIGCAGCGNIEWRNVELDKPLYASLSNEVAANEIRIKLLGDPTNTLLRYRLINIYISELLFDEAIIELQRAIEINGTDAHAYQLLSLLLTKQPKSQPQRALSVLEQGAIAVPFDMQIRISLALLLVDLGDLDRAQLEAAKALEIAMDSDARSSVFLILASIYKRRGQSDAADRYFAMALKLRPDIAKELEYSIDTIPVYIGRSGSIFKSESHPTLRGRVERLDRLTR